MSSTFYIKKGRRYVPISEYDEEFSNSYRMGTTLVFAKPGSLSKRPIDPNFAAMIAAGSYARDKITDVLIEASSARPMTAPVTETQQKAWKKLKEAYGEEMSYLAFPSAVEAVDAGIDAMCKEAETMLQNPAVRAAYDQFMMVCQLTKDQFSTQG